jgi:predicted acetyltransferase
MNAIAVRPSLTFDQPFLTMLGDFAANDTSNIDLYAPARVDFGAYVQSLLDEEAGQNLPAGYVPCSHRWLLDSAGEIVGVTRLRHNINTPFLAENGGHIGYDVAPSKRGRGYGHVALAVALSEAQRIGLRRVLLYTSQENTASRKVIESAGGVLEQVAYSEFWQEQLCKYWISLAAEDQLTPTET